MNPLNLAPFMPVPNGTIGGLAVGLHGYQRATVDVGFLVAGLERNTARSVLEAAGFNCMVETAESMHFVGRGAVDLLLANRSPTRAMLADAVCMSNVSVPVLRVEDILGLKIQAYHNDPKRKWRDQADIAELLRANPNMDWKRVMTYAVLFQAETELEEIRHSILP